MNEQLRRYYVKEEEFLDEFSDAAWVAARHIAGDWTPDSDCNDRVRGTREYFLRSGELDGLVFDGAAVFDNAEGFSSVQIVLQSSKRKVTVRVRREGHGLVAETVVDRQVSDTSV